MTSVSQSQRKSEGLTSVCLIAAIAIAGCSPVVGIASAVLGGLGGGSSRGAPASTGGFGGAASALAQNVDTKSTVQNSKPTEQVFREVLDHADTQTVWDSCVEQLPPEAMLPLTECVIRPACIPGVSRPLQMRTCPIDTTSAPAGLQYHEAKPVNASPDWSW